jgi:hypothetical protein
MRSKGRDEVLEPLDAPFWIALVEEGHVVGALVEHGAEDVLEEVLGEVGVVGEVGEGDLRLDHPELGQVPAGVGVLGAEGGAEGVDPAHREAVGLDVELAGDGEAGLRAEEVLPKSTSPSGARRVGGVQRGDAEHLARALGIAGGDDGGVDPEEAVLVEEAVDRHRPGVPHPGDRAEGVGARRRCATSRRYSKECALGLDRVGLGVVHPADHLDRRRVDLERLPLPWRLRDHAPRDERGPAGEALHLALVVRQVTTCSGAKEEPSLRWMKESPAFESRRVRTQPSTVTDSPGATARRGFPWSNNAHCEKRGV